MHRRKPDNKAGNKMGNKSCNANKNNAIQIQDVIPAMFVLIGITLILIAGCGSLPKRSEKQGTKQTIETHVGKEGIAMAFVQNAPPQKIFSVDEQALNILVEVKNKGAYNVKKDEIAVSLGGYDKNILEIESDKDRKEALENQKFSFDIEGKSEFMPEGGIAIIGWKTRDIKFPPDRDTIKQSFTVAACYKYKTLFSENICLDSRPSDQVKEKICEPVVKTYSKGQGAPVGIVKIEEAIIPTIKQAKVKVYIQNSGNGKVLDTGKNKANGADILDKCSRNSITLQDLNRVSIKAFVQDKDKRKELKCEPSTISLYQNQGTSVCTIDLPESGAYTTPVSFELDYGYTSSIQKEVDIVTSQSS